MLNIKVVSLIGLMSLLSGCLYSTPTLPGWVSNKPQSAHTYYAIGQGVNLYDAELKARASMAAELSSNVSDLTRVYSVDDGKFQQQIFEQFTTVEVSDINISHALVTQHEVSDKHYFVLLEMSTKDLASQLKNETLNEIRKVKVVVAGANPKTFERWWQLRQVLPSVKRITRNITLLERLAVKHYKAEAALVSAYFKQFDASYGTRELAIKNLTKAERIHALLSKQLQEENIKLADSSFWTKPGYIEASTEYSNQRIGQENYVDAVLWLRLKSSTGQVLAEFSLDGRGVAYGSFKQSRAIADQVLYSKLKRSNIFKHLFDKQVVLE